MKDTIRHSTLLDPFSREPTKLEVICSVECMLYVISKMLQKHHSMLVRLDV